MKDIIMGVLRWYRYIASKKILIISLTLLGALLGVTYSLLKKTTYIATSTFVLEDGNKAGMGQYTGIAALAGIELGNSGGLFQGDNILELYRSRRMIVKALLSVVENNGKRRLLVDHYIDFNNLRKTWEKNPALLNVQFNEDKENFTRLQDSLMIEIVKDINNNYLTVSKLDKKLNIIKVDTKAENEFFAKNFNDQIVKNVNDFYIMTKTQKSLENVAILQQKTDSVQAVMTKTIYSSASTLDATPNLNPTRQILRAQVQRSQSSMETNKAILGELLKNLELSKISLRKETPLIQVIDHPIYPLEKEIFSMKKGIVLGGFLAAFIAVLVVSIKRALKLLIR